MYDTFLSKQWIFDRCIEGSSLLGSTTSFIIVGIFAVILFYFIFFKFFKLQEKLIKKVLFGLIFYVVIFVYSFFFLQLGIALFGFILVGCNAGGQFFPGINAAHA